MDSDRINRRLEILEAVLLSLAVLGTAWSAYQGTLWSGIQTFRLADANGKGREATAKQLLAAEQRTLDGNIMMNFVQAVVEKKPKVVEFYLKRTRPEMRAALKAWLDTNPLENAEAPAHPGVMAEYASSVPRKFEAEHQSLRAEGDRKMQEANEANNISDNYVLMTVLETSPRFLCFVSLASKFEGDGVRIAVLVPCKLDPDDHHRRNAGFYPLARENDEAAKRRAIAAGSTSPRRALPAVCCRTSLAAATSPASRPSQPWREQSWRSRSPETALRE